MKKLLVCAMALSVALGMAGCGDDKKAGDTKSAPAKQQVVEKQVEKKVEKKAEKKINFEFANKSLKEDIKATEKLVKDIVVKVDENSKEIQFSIVVNPAVNDAYVLDLIDTVLRKYNMFCGAGGSSKDKYGNLYDDYSVMIGIATPANINNTNKWLVFDGLGKGVQTKHKFKVKR